MIRRELKSRLIELEKRYAAAVQAKRNEADAPPRFARLHAIEVAAMALYGEPKMEEPLEIARFRMEKKLKEEFAAAAKDWMRERGENGNPLMVDFLCEELMFNALPGANDNLKFERIFSKAPVWLLKFTGVEWDAKLLGFKFASSSERQSWDRKPGVIEIDGHLCLREQSMPEGHVRIRTNHGKEL